MKYIVYKTTNLINNKIYVGVHKTADPNIFDGYIGCGCYKNKPSSYAHPKTVFQCAVKKYGANNFKRDIISTFNNEIEAYLLEAQIVNEEFLARDDVYNMVLGGYMKPINCIKVYSYDKEGFFIKEYESIVSASRELNKSHSAVWNALVFKYSCSGYYFNTDKLDKIDLSNYNNKPEAQPIYRYLVDGGRFDKEFFSLTSAALESDLTLVQVTRSAKIGYRAGEYQFCYVKSDSYDKAKNIYVNNRSVTKYSADGDFIKEYLTQYEAELDNPGSNISKSIKNKKPCNNNFLWSLESLPKFCAKRNTQKKKVGKFTLEGELLQEWESKKACIKETGISDRYIVSEKPYKNYIYKYV